MIRSALLAVAVLLPCTSFAQAWPRDQGHGYLGFDLRRISGGSYFGADFEGRSIPKYTQLSIGMYAELGIVDRWLTATLSGEIYRRNELEAQGSTSGLGDLRLGLWTGLITEPFHLGAGLIAGLPSGDDQPTAGSGADLEAELIANSLPTGDGEWDFEPSLIFGTGFEWALIHYLVIQTGYTLRTRGFSDAISYRVELGTKIPVEYLDRIWIIARVYGLESFASNAEAANSFSGLGNGVTHTSYSTELYARLWDKLGISVARDSAFRARSIIAAAAWKLGLSYEF